MLCFSLAAFGQTTSKAPKVKKAVVETTFQVSGVCGMCEERIENALSVKGVKLATYDLETQMCRVIYRSDKIEEATLHRLLNEVGHDTALSKATDEQYETVHGCCKYRTGGIKCDDE